MFWDIAISDKNKIWDRFIVPHKTSFEEHNSNGVSLASCFMTLPSTMILIISYTWCLQWEPGICYRERNAETVRDLFSFIGCFIRFFFSAFVTIHLLLWVLCQIVWLSHFTYVVTNSCLVRFCLLVLRIFCLFKWIYFWPFWKGQGWSSSLGLTSKETLRCIAVLSTLHTLTSFMPEELISKMFWSQKPGHQLKTKIEPTQCSIGSQSRKQECCSFWTFQRAEGCMSEVFGSWIK